MNGKANGAAQVEQASAAQRPPATISLEAGERFVETPAVKAIANRALGYLKAGYPVHFSGPAGTGKTTLALHVAALRGRPVALMHGDDEFGSSDLVGGDYGYRKSRVVDNFIHSVVKTEENMSTLWADNRLTVACKNGDTLVYDEFTRSRAEANNALLSVLEERILSLPKRHPHGEGFIEVHPEFRAVLTSNPEEYAGVHRTQDALSDRLITIQVDHFDRETELRITQAKSGIAVAEAEVIVDIVRSLRSLGLTKHGPSLRACIMIARVTVQEKAHAAAGDAVFSDVCRDVLGSLTAKVVRDGEAGVRSTVDEVVARHVKRPRAEPRPRAVPRPEAALIEEGSA